MKILELRFKNLNSLYGEWKIDLTSPEYTADGIFAITGPTGSGKSTILDAICLALYGRTPRLERINKGGNDIMSRQTGECYAEVVFESQAGQFRCTWSQHRARKRPDGKLAEANHEIADARTGDILESKKTATQALIEEKTGMDMDRFTRSMMLAQGGFAAFLQATPDERAPILEQITGTEIYSEISRQVYERQKLLRINLDLLQAEVRGIVLLDQSQLSQMTTDLAKLQQQQQTSVKSLSELRTSIAWLTGMTELEQQISGLVNEEHNLTNAIQAFGTQRAALERAQKAAEHEGIYAALLSLREQKTREEQALADALAQKALLSEVMSVKAQTLAKAGEITAAAKTEALRAAPVIRQARALDIQIENVRTSIKEIQAETDRIQKQLKQNRAARRQTDESMQNLADQLDKLVARIDSRSADRLLVTDLTGITEKLSGLLGLANDLEKRRKEAQFTEKKLLSAEQTQTKAELAVNASNEALRLDDTRLVSAKQALDAHLKGRRLRDYRQEHENLLRELALRQKIASLEAERQALTDGKPCPLCGSTNHPYAAGNQPEIVETELRLKESADFIEAAEGLTENVQIAEDQHKETEKKAAIASQALRDAAAAHDRISSDLNRISNEIKDRNLRYDSQLDEILSRLKPLGIVEIAMDKIQVLAADLQERQKTWSAMQDEKSSLENGIQKLSAETNRLDALFTSSEQLFNERTGALDLQNKTWTDLERKRFETLEDKLADQEENRLNQQLAAAEAAEKLARDDHQSAKAQHDDVRIKSEQHQAALSRLTPECSAREAEFVAGIVQAGFADEADFCQKKMAAAERKLLADKARQLDDGLLDAKARLKDKTQALAREKARALTATPLPSLEIDLPVMEEQNLQISQSIGAIQQSLSADQNARAETSEKRTRIESLQLEWSRWSRLNELVGSADGKKFRNFAQGMTFEILIAHANRQLERLTDRYLLTRDEASPLDLCVVDNYQAGEIRTTKNLSGGECFIISLALALGLSKMSSRRVRVDSLFLDEGFGTLDEDALESALETLASLQQDGKLIGIISHVPALKERISTRISILPVSGGRSSISGPGVEACRETAD